MKSERPGRDEGLSGSGHVVSGKVSPFLPAIAAGFSVAARSRGVMDITEGAIYLLPNGKRYRAEKASAGGPVTWVLSPVDGDIQQGQTPGAAFRSLMEQTLAILEDGRLEACVFQDAWRAEFPDTGWTINDLRNIACG
jgi:hypothetical protein